MICLSCGCVKSQQCWMTCRVILHPHESLVVCLCIVKTLQAVPVCQSQKRHHPCLNILFMMRTCHFAAGISVLQYSSCRRHCKMSLLGQAATLSHPLMSAVTSALSSAFVVTLAMWCHADCLDDRWRLVSAQTVAVKDTRQQPVASRAGLWAGLQGGTALLEKMARPGSGLQARPRGQRGLLQTSSSGFRGLLESKSQFWWTVSRASSGALPGTALQLQVL